MKIKIEIETLALTFLILGVFFIPSEMMIRNYMPYIGSIPRVMLGACFLFTALYWIKTGLKNDSNRQPINNYSYFFAVVFLFWQGISMLWSQWLSRSISIFFTYIQLNLFYLTILILIKTQKRLEILMQVFVLGYIICIAGCLLSLISGSLTHDLRYSSGRYDPNDLALALALAIPLAWHLYSKNIRYKYINLIFIPFLVFSIITTGSRGGFIVACLGFLYILFTLLAKKIHLSRKLGFVSVVIIGIIIIYQFIPNSVWETQWQRIATIQAEISEKGTLSDRTTIWKEAISVFKEHSIFGTGVGSFLAQGVNMPRGSHNYFLLILVEEGIIGFALFSVFYLYIAKNMVISLKRNGDMTLYICMLLLLTIGVMSLNWETFKITYLIYGLCSVAVIVQDENKRPNLNIE